MAYTSPLPTQAVGGTILASDWNTYLRDNLAAMVDWTSYTPTFTQGGTTVTKTVTYAKYRRFGTTCKVNIRLDATGAGSAGLLCIVGLPSGGTASTVSGLIVGSGEVTDTGTATYPAVSVVNTATTLIWHRADQDPGAGIGSNPSFTVASTDVFIINAEYETT